MLNLNAFLDTEIVLSSTQIIDELHLQKEIELYNLGYDYILGFDEAGRGAWAGGIIVGCSMLPFFLMRMGLCDKEIFFNACYRLSGVKDSKKLTPKKRESLLQKIEENTLFSYAITSSRNLDLFGITSATQQSMNKAFLNVMDSLTQFNKTFQLNLKLPDNKNTVILSDYGLSSDFVESSGIQSKLFIHGEDISLSIASASIVAKVYRDKEMEEMHSNFPEYDFKSNKGYHSKRHVEALKTYGGLPIHRASYGEISQYPLKPILYK